MGSGYKGYLNTEGAKYRLKPKELLRELEQSNYKYNKADIVMITKNYSGKLMWLEKGNFKSGLKHIELRHRKDFEKIQIFQYLRRKFYN